MKALVTGAGGFCGKHLTAYLSQQGIEVHSVSCNDSARPYHHRVADVIDIGALTDLMRSIRPNYVFHLAGISQASDPTLFYKINTQYAVALLESMKISKLDSPVLLVGTAAEYGKITDTELPIRENINPHPYNHYGISKLSQTLAGIAAWHEGQPVIVARPFNIIGTGMPDYISVQSFAIQIADIIKGRMPPLLEVGNLTTIRDFVDVRDVVKIYWKLIQNPAAYGEIVNICSGRQSSMKYLVSKLISLSGIKNIDVKISPSRLKTVDIPVHYGSTEKLSRLAGFVPTITIDESLPLILEDTLNR